MLIAEIKKHDLEVRPLPDPDVLTATDRGVGATSSIRKPLDLRALTPRVLDFAPTVDRRIRIVLPFTVVLEKTPGGFVARADEINEFGHGLDSGEALHDLGKTIVELYFSLRDEHERLSADLQSVFATLKQHIEDRRI